MSSHNKNILIFGGIGGIGGALADLLTQRGNTVYVTTSNLERASESALPGTQVLYADALNHESIQSAVRQAGTNGLDGLAYCIGTINLKPMTRTTAEDLIRDFQVNTVGAFSAVKEAAAYLGKARGSVVLFSSIAAARGFSNHSAIATAKAGLEGLARTLAAELAPNIRVNVIAPSLTDTPLAKSLTQNPKMREAIEAMHPLPRLGEAREIASAAAFLLSEESGWITGQTLHIDGGRFSVEKPR